MIHIAPSILSADFAALGNEIRAISDAGADMVHIDIMDGHFVPNITIGYDVVRSIRPHTKLLFDVHLMVTDPLQYLEAMVNVGADIITVHYESDCDIMFVLQKIKNMGCKAGLALKPTTQGYVIDQFLDVIDLALVMTVNPGFGGQGFMHDQLSKIRYIAEAITVSGRDILLEVDGGINDKTAALVKQAGANVLVSGSYIFGAEDMKNAIETLRG